MNRVWILVIFAFLGLSTACGGGGMGGSSPTRTFSLTVSSSSLKAFPDQSASTLSVTISRQQVTDSITLAVSGVPSGATATVTQPGTGNSGSISIDAGTASAGSYPVTITASTTSLHKSTNFNLIVGAVAQIQSTSTQRFELAMSTSFQPAEWNSNFFMNWPAATTALGNLLPQHIRLQPLSQGVPQRTATTWDFSVVDGITQPVLGVGDHSPEFQIAKAPPFMYAGNDSGNSFQDLTFAQFAGYTQNLVRYYNKGGFTASDGHHVSPSAHSIEWWGIYNEPNLNNNLTPAQYVDLYNATVPAMQTVDPSLKFVALELADFSNEPHDWVPPFVNGVTAQVDAIATHFYSSCNQHDTDVQIFNIVTSFAADVEFFYQQLATKPALSSVPVWVTENNVNADFDKGGGISACNGTAFTRDDRGSSAFFAAWRPYVFSQLGRAKAKVLYHWDFNADPQFGEFNDSNGQLMLSYWVDYWLARMFPSPPGADLLHHSNTDDADLEILAVKNDDGSVVVMVANRAVAAAADNNGPGAPRTVALNLSALGSFTTGSLLTIDATTNVTSGPSAAPVTPADRMEITLDGYGVAFLKLQ